MSLPWTIAAAGWLQVPVSSNCQTAQSVQCSLMVDSTFEAITSHKPKLWHEQHGDGCFVHHASPTMFNPCQGEATCRFMTSCFCPQATFRPVQRVCHDLPSRWCWYTCSFPSWWKLYSFWAVEHTVPSPALTHSLLILPTLPCACLHSPVFPCSPALSLSTTFPHFTDFSCCECSAPLPILGHPVCPLVPTLANAP